MLSLIVMLVNDRGASIGRTNSALFSILFQIGKKRQLHQQDRVGGLSAFTDDGFAMGLAYILRLLDQGRRIGVSSPSHPD